MSDPASSLELLHDIVEPAAAAWWPPAPGWCILLALCVLALLAGLLRAFIHWQRNRYRREALRLLSQLPPARGEWERDRQRLAAVAEILKRTALTAYPRGQVAMLSGGEWFEFLDKTGNTRFRKGIGAAMEASIYSAAGGAWQAEQFAELETQVRQWIRQHDALRPRQPGSPA